MSIGKDSKGAPPRFSERLCQTCGKKWIGQGACPTCGGLSKGGDEYTRKTFDAPDLLK